MQKIQPKIIIIGAGRVAFNLTHALHKAQLPPEGIINRTYRHAEALAKEFGLPLFSDKFEQIPEDTTHIILAISDDAIAPVARRLIDYCPAECIVTHTSGITPIGILNAFKHYGLFYPLGTFNRESPTDMTHIPFIIDGNSAHVLNTLEQTAKRISKSIYHLNDTQRPFMHLGAVFANNFTNALLGVAFEILEKQGINREILFPIIEQTLHNALTKNPWEIQSGPAARKDVLTISKHEKLLSEDGLKKYKSIYLLLTKLIIQLDANTFSEHHTQPVNISLQDIKKIIEEE